MGDVEETRQTMADITELLSEANSLYVDDM